jgi:hypothetical protein
MTAGKEHIYAQSHPEDEPGKKKNHHVTCREFHKVWERLCASSASLILSTPQTLAQLKPVIRVDGACRSRSVQGVELTRGFRVRPNSSGRNHSPYHDTQSLAATCKRVLLLWM